MDGQVVVSAGPHPSQGLNEWSTSTKQLPHSCTQLLQILRLATASVTGARHTLAGTTAEHIVLRPCHWRAPKLTYPACISHAYCRCAYYLG